MRYLLLDIGCFECGDDTEIGEIVSEVPEGYKVAKLGSPAGASYSDYRIAVELESI